MSWERRYKVKSKGNGWSKMYFVFDTITKKIVSKDFFYKSFAEDFKTDLVLQLMFN